MKRGFFFSFDSLIAIVLVSIAIYLFFIKWEPDLDTEKADALSKETIDMLQSVRIRDICHGGTPGEFVAVNCSCIYDTVTYYYCRGEIYNYDLTLLELVGEFYSRRMYNETNQILNETIKKSNIIPENYGYCITVDDFETGTRNTSIIHPLP